MTTIYLIRHAEAEGNFYRRIHGWYNSRITENGWRQIRALEDRFGPIPIDAVVSSDRFRTMATARAVYLPKGLPLTTDPGLRELHLGRWEDMTWGEVMRNEGEELARFFRSDPTWCAPEGETFHELGARMEETLRRIVETYPRQSVAVFSHGMAIRQLVMRVKGIPPEEWRLHHNGDNTSVTRLDWDGAAFRVVMEGDSAHLSPAISTYARQERQRAKMEGAEHLTFWFQPLDVAQPEDRTLYMDARLEAWKTVHGDGPVFDGERYLRDATKHAQRMEWGLCKAMLGDQIAGILQLDPKRYEKDRAGYLAFFYIMPDLRAHGLATQLLGQTVSVFRARGFQYIRLRCAPYNITALNFYRRNGFYKIGEEQGSTVPLDIMEKYIGYDVDKILEHLPDEV